MVINFTQAYKHLFVWAYEHMGKENEAADDDNNLIWDDASFLRRTLYPYRFAHTLDGSKNLMNEINGNISEY